MHCLSTCTRYKTNVFDRKIKNADAMCVFQSRIVHLSYIWHIYVIKVLHYHTVQRSYCIIRQDPGIGFI